MRSEFVFNKDEIITITTNTKIQPTFYKNVGLRLNALKYCSCYFPFLQTQPKEGNNKNNNNE